MTTEHDCGGPIFGRLTAGCPRCDELIAGAVPVQWRQRNSTQPPHRHSGTCNPVCTYGDW